MLQGWDDTKKLKIIIDNNKIDGNLTDFPILLSLSDSVGITSYDASCVFDEVSAHPYEVCDDFTGANGSALDTNLWRVSSSSNVDIYNNKLRFADNNNASSAYSEFTLSGDFNIQIDFEIVSGPSTNSWAAETMVYLNNNNDYISVRRGYYSGNHKYAMEGNFSGVWTGIGTNYNSTDTSGKLCVIRVGNVFSGYFWHSSGYWYLLGSRTCNTAQNDIKYIKFNHSCWTGNPSFSFYFDNFKVNNGTPYFPSRLAITATVSGVETQCYTEIETWEQENNKAILWTKISTVASGSDTELSLYYDKSHLNNWDYVNFVGTPAGKAVWDSNFVGVWHMGQDPTGGSDCIKDSTSNTNHGTPAGSMTSSDLVDGKIGKGLDFDGSGDTISCGTGASLSITDEITLTALIKPDTTTGGDTFNSTNPRYIFRKGENQPNVNYWFRVLGTKIDFIFYAGGSWRGCRELTGSVVATEYQEISVTFTSNGTARLYRNGAETYNASVNYTMPSSTDALSLFGDITNAQRYFDGIAEEVRISNIIRSASWIKATYHSNWDSLITYEQYERCFSGVVTVESAPTIRRVNLYNQDTGELINYTISSGTGEWSINVYGDTVNKYYAICVPESSNRNAEIFAHLTGI